MKKMMVLLGAMLALFVGQSVYAANIWSETLDGFRLVLRENTGWVSSPLLPEHCEPLRAEIRIFGTDYDKALFKFAMSSAESGQSIQVLVDDSDRQCVVLGIRWR